MEKPPRLPENFPAESWTPHVPEKLPLLPPGTVVDLSKAHITPSLPGASPPPPEAPKKTDSKSAFILAYGVVWFGVFCLLAPWVTIPIAAIIAALVVSLGAAVYKGDKQT